MAYCRTEQVKGYLGASSDYDDVLLSALIVVVCLAAAYIGYNRRDLYI
jgi:hypothetical protein